MYQFLIDQTKPTKRIIKLHQERNTPKRTTRTNMAKHTTHLLTYAALILLQLYNTSVATAAPPPDEETISQLDARDVIVDIYPVRGLRFTIHERIDWRRVSNHRVLARIPVQQFQTQTDIEAVQLMYGAASLACRFQMEGQELSSEEFGHTQRPMQFEDPPRGVHSLTCSLKGKGLQLELEE